MVSIRVQNETGGLPSKLQSRKKGRGKTMILMDAINQTGEKYHHE